MAAFGQVTERIPGITISLGESVSIPTEALGQLRRQSKHQRSVSEANKLPPAVAVVPSEHIRGYVHNKRVNNYLVGSTLGEGSFAKVKEGFHVLVGEKVAMKIIDKRKAQQDPYVAKNFRREAKLLQMVRHPNILQLYEVIETDTSFYLITELCSGGELMKYIYKKQKLDENETRKFMRQIVSAVDHLHKAGIIHRDLKVENMLLDSNMDLRLIDFGLSNEEFVESESGHIHCNTQCGSPAYAAPELLGHKEYGKEVDIWSIGVNMYAMLTGCLPYTVEPFNITALHAKMLDNKMNPIPDYLSTDCKDLLQNLLRPNPSERITLTEIMSHPWMNEGHRLPFEPHPFPNKLKHYELNTEIIEHMVHTLNVRDSIEELKQELLSNRATLASAIYNLLEARLKRYIRQNRHLRRTSRPARFSRDQGFFEAEDSDETSSTISAPARPRHSRQHRKVSLNHASKKDRPISYPPKDTTQNAMTAVQAPTTFSFTDRRKSIPGTVLEKEIANFTARKKEKEISKRQQQRGFMGRKASTLPRKFSVGSSHLKDTTLQAHREKTPPTKQPFHRAHSPLEPYEYDLPQHTEITDLSPPRPPTVHLVRNGYSHSHALNQIRHDLNQTLQPPPTKAWHSNPNTRSSSRDPSRHGSKNPSLNPSRAPSGSSIRTPPSGSSHLDIIDDDVEDLTFHEVESHNLVVPDGDRHRRWPKEISSGSGSSGTMEEDDHLPHLQQPLHYGYVPQSRRRQRTMSDVSDTRIGFLSQAFTYELPSDLHPDAIVTELVKVSELMKMRELVSGHGMVMGVMKGVRIRILVKKDNRGSCHIVFQWMSGGDFKSYQDICDGFIQRTRL